LDFLKIFLVGLMGYFLIINFELYSGGPFFELIFDTFFIFLLILMSLLVVKMKYINLKRTR